jgi:dsDNA-specific endonuclease/ATPase MutS2
VAPDVSEIQERIQSLREQRREAALDFRKADEIQLTEEIEAASLELLRAEQSATVRQASAQSYQAAFVSAVEMVESKYPESADDSSAFSRILDDKVAAAKARHDPALANPNFLVAFADEVAEMLGQKAPAKEFQRPPARPSRPVGSSLAPGHQSAARLSHDDALRLIQSASIEDLKAVVFTE